MGYHPEELEFCFLYVRYVISENVCHEVGEKNSAKGGACGINLATVVDLWNSPKVGKRQLNPQSCPLTSTYTNTCWHISTRVLNLKEN